MKKPNSQEIIDFLNDKWNGTPCPMCRKGEWSVTDKVFELREFHEGNLVIGGPGTPIVPVIPVTCKNCGNTVLINPMVVGLLKE